MKKTLIVIVLIAAAGSAYIFHRHKTTVARETPRYEPVRLQRGDIEVSMETTGVVEPRNRLEIKPPIGGRIEDISVREGDVVSKSQVVGWMSSTERAALLDSARTEGADTLRKWEDAYKPTPLIAPLGGTIIARKKEPGQTVTTQDPVLVLSDALIVRAQVDETDIAKVNMGQTAIVKLDAYPEVRVRGSVHHIAYEAITVNNVTIYEVEVSPEHIPECMKSGMTASVDFLVASVTNVLTLPADAVQTEGAHPVVLVDDEDPETPPESRTVRTGVSGGGQIEIVEGLTGNENVVRRSFRLPQKKKNADTPFLPRRRR